MEATFTEPFIRDWGVFKTVFVFKFASKGSLFSGLPGRVRKVGVEGKVFRDLRADRLSLLAVLPAAGGGSCEALARWPAPRFNPGFLMLRPSPRIAGGRPPSPPLSSLGDRSLEALAPRPVPVFPLQGTAAPPDPRGCEVSLFFRGGGAAVPRGLGSARLTFVLGIPAKAFGRA